MATLTKTQLEHAKTKVKAAAAARLQAFRRTLGDRPQVPEYTPGERRAMILDGTATPNVTDFEDDIRYKPFADCFDYPSKPEMAAAQALVDAYDAKVHAEEEVVDTIKDALIDELVMSPDGMAALAKIAAAFAS